MPTDPRDAVLYVTQRAAEKAAVRIGRSRGDVCAVRISGLRLGARSDPASIHVGDFCAWTILGDGTSWLSSYEYHALLATKETKP